MRFLRWGELPAEEGRSLGLVCTGLAEPQFTTIHMRFQSVWPAMRIRTQPSMRPRMRVVGVSRALEYNQRL
jgi:hypothetical protein